MLRPGVVAKVLSRFYPVFEELAGALGRGGTRGAVFEPGWLDAITRFLGDGQHRNQDGNPAGFTTSYMHRPQELPAEIADAGLELRELLAGSGSVKLIPGLSEMLDHADGRDQVLSLLRLLEAEPSLIGMSQNLVAIAQVQ